MKRQFVTIIFLLTLSINYAQMVPPGEFKYQCVHHRSASSPGSLDHLYNWQSKFLDYYDVGFYFLDIEVSGTTTFVSGNVTIYANSILEMDTLAFELVEAHTIDSLFVNDISYNSYIREGDNVLVPINKIPAGKFFRFQVYYRGDPGDTGFLSGLSKAYSEKYDKHVVWSLSEPFGAKEWFPVKQDLEDKADSCWVFLTTSAGNMAGSQGILTNVAVLNDGKVRYEWKSRYPIAYYLISFAVTDYMEYNTYAHPADMDGDSLLIQNFIYNDPACFEEHQPGIDQTAGMIELFSELFGKYPFYEEKYGHCLTQLPGGMEHQTMSTMGSFSFGLVAHELGHMWFGDNVTCATWSDIWINEGFATYANCLAEEFIHGPESGRNFIRSSQNNAMSQPGGSTYIPESQISLDNQWRIFSGRLSYDKGAAILHTLRHEIQDDEQFFAVLSEFQLRFADSTATGEDFRQVAEELTGKDFQQFFDQWYYGQGYPTYDIRYYMEEGSLHMNVTQTASTSATRFFRMLMDYQVLFEDGSDTLVQFEQTDNINTFSIYLGKAVDTILIDPNDWTMEKTGNVTTTGEDHESTHYFTLGPNPAAGMLNLYFLNPSNQPREIRIHDMAGKVVYETVSVERTILVETAELPLGIYLVTAKGDGERFVRKFVK